MSKPSVVDIPSRRRNDRFEPGILWVLAGLAVIVFVIFLLVPAFKGYRMYKAAENAGIASDFIQEMEGLEAAKQRAEEQRVAAEQRAAAEQRELEEKASAFEADLQTCLNSSAVEDAFRQQLEESFSKDMARVRRDLRVCEEDSERVIDNAARRICCVQRVDNPDISGYTIEKNKITCVTENGKEIEC